jgi:hypothetical protein
MNFGDGEAIVLFFQGDIGLGVHLISGEAGFAQNQRQGHGEAASMGGANQFFRIGAGLAFEAAGKAIRIILKRAALGGNRALAILEPAMPDGSSKSRHIGLLPLTNLRPLLDRLFNMTIKTALVPGFHHGL